MKENKYIIVEIVAFIFTGIVCFGIVYLIKNLYFN